MNVNPSKYGKSYEPQRVMSNGEGDYVKDGELFYGVVQRAVMVEAETDLANLPDGLYPPGSMAYTAGFKAMWQKASDGMWVDMMSDEDSTDEFTDVDENAESEPE